MPAKDVRFHEDARAKMVNGVNILANAVKATIHIENVARFKYTSNEDLRNTKTTDESGCIVTLVDCSALMNATVGTYYLVSNTSSEMYAYFQSHKGFVSKSQARPGDLIFFRNHLNKGLVQHVGEAMGDNHFTHITASHDARIRTQNLAELRNAPGADEKYSYDDDVIAYGNLDALPLRDAPGVAAKLAPTGEKTVRFGAKEPGGVYISPDLVAEAAGMSGSEILDEISSAVDHADFKKAPVQQIDVPEVQDY